MVNGGRSSLRIDWCGFDEHVSRAGFDKVERVPLKGLCAQACQALFVFDQAEGFCELDAIWVDACPMTGSDDAGNLGADAIVLA